ncbi:MAG: hypothetical protein IKL79_01515 [Clostridia bacterium]|nr:hypothetical protein [Clostridia bacterium]
MPKWLNKFVEFLLLRKRVKIKSKISRDGILAKVEQIADNTPEVMLYRMTRNGFFISEKYTEAVPGGYSKDAFAPIIRARLSQEEGVTLINVAIRPNFLVYLVYLPIHIISICLVVTIPIAYIFTRAFFERANILSDKLENLLLED